MISRLAGSRRRPLHAVASGSPLNIRDEIANVVAADPDNPAGAPDPAPAAAGTCAPPAGADVRPSRPQSAGNSHTDPTPWRLGREPPTASPAGQWSSPRRRRLARNVPVCPAP